MAPQKHGPVLKAKPIMGQGRDQPISRLQACPADTMARLLLYRFDLNVWHLTGRRGPMPQPWEYGLNLPDLRPSEIHWRGSR